MYDADKCLLSQHCHQCAVRNTLNRNRTLFSTIIFSIDYHSTIKAGTFFGFLEIIFSSSLSYSFFKISKNEVKKP